MTEQSNDPFAALQEWASQAAQLIAEAKPKTDEEWQEAYDELFERYSALHKAADRVASLAMAPKYCRPTTRQEDGSVRKLVATRALDELKDELTRS